MEKKIVYLFGAGATHAEIMNLQENPDEAFRIENGLLISHVSNRVMKMAQNEAWFKENEDVFTSTKGSLNIELLISLFESNRISDVHINRLKELVQEDIKGLLTVKRKQDFYLHKALLELHEKITSKEKLAGIISLNYDDVLDEAYKEILKKDPNYGFTSSLKKELPLLKLHGSFNWQGIEIYETLKDIPIIPIGVNKNYLAPPYNFIWGHAYELLVNCDILRVIGCSLNQSDMGLIDLLFKAHLERKKNFEIQIVDFQPLNGHHSIKNNYGFFPNITEPIKIEDTLINDSLISDYDIGNPFKIWLKAKGQKMIEGEIANTIYLKKLFD